MPNYNRNYSPSEFDSLLKKYDDLCQIRDAVVRLTGEEELGRILWKLDLLGMGLHLPEPGQKYIYVVQSKSHFDDNSVKVGFCKDIYSRWGGKWESFIEKKAFISPFKGDAEVHEHLRSRFERDLEKGREVYFGEFSEISSTVEKFLENN
jgi:hypothetical protein